MRKLSSVVDAKCGSVGPVSAVSVISDSWGAGRMALQSVLAALAEDLRWSQYSPVTVCRLLCTRRAQKHFLIVC